MEKESMELNSWWVSMKYASSLTVLGTMNPENKFQKLRKKDMAMAAIWGPGVSATIIIPYIVK